MAYLTAAVVLVGTIGMFNLLLAFGIIRRLREHTRLLASSPSEGSGLQVVGIGSPLGPFVTSTLDGSAISTDDVTGSALVGFFSPDCGPCHAMIPRFVASAREMSGAERPVAVIVNDGHAVPHDMIESLRPVARVVVEERGGPMTSAFAVHGFPAICRVDDSGVIRAAAMDTGATMAASRG